MCTAITYTTGDHYFGRTLDYEYTYGEQVTVMPRRFVLTFRNFGTLERHYAVIGMAGLNFVGNAVYHQPVPGKDNVVAFELIPWILCRCATVREALEQMENMNLTDEAFNHELPPAELHWFLADREEAVTVESTREGLKIWPNPVGVLTNNPTFPEQLFRLNDFIGLSPKSPENRFASQLDLESYSRGMGALGLPGDLSSQSRFVRAAFTKLNSRSGKTEGESVSQFFHILGTVEQVRGCCEVEGGRFEITQYTSCCNASRGIYYYTTYDNRRITAVDMHRENLGGDQLICYPLVRGEQMLAGN